MNDDKLRTQEELMSYLMQKKKNEERELKMKKKLKNIEKLEREQQKEMKLHK